MPAAQGRRTSSGGRWETCFLVLEDNGKNKRKREKGGKGKLSDVCPDFSSPGFCLEMARFII